MIGDDDLIALTCVAVRTETALAKTYVLAPDQPGALRFTAGQFLNLVFTIDGEEHLRSYSISSSSASSGTVAITVKRVEGGRVSNWLYDHLKPGDRLKASGPAGVFTLDGAAERPLLLLTAGSGITPAASMMRSLADHGAGIDVVFLHFARGPGDIIFREEMALWARHLPKARVIPVITRPAPGDGWIGPVARLSRDLLAALIPDVASRQVYCCGPEGFMDAAGTLLEALGLPGDQLVLESFGSAAPEPDPLPGPAEVTHAVGFAKSKTSCEVPDGTTVLSAAGQAGVRIQTSCRNGVCGTCRVKLKSGTVEMAHKGGIKPREIERGFILACCSKPTSDVEVDI